MNNKRIIKKEKRDSIVIKDRSKLKKKLAIGGAILCAIIYIFVLSYDFPKEEPENGAVDPVVTEEEQEPEAVQPVDGGMLRISVSRFSSVNPYKNNEKTMDNFFRLVYDSLFELDKDYNLVPELASGYTISGDGKTMTISINPAARWQDGSRVTPQDVAFTIGHIKSNPQSPYYYLVSNIANTTPGPSAITIELGQPNALEIYNMIFPIISSKSIGGSGLLKDDNFAVIGNGMFQVSQYNKGQNIRLKKNDNYYGPMPHINEIEVQIYSDNTIRKNMFMASSSDIIESSYYDLNKYEYDVFRSSAYQSRKFDFISFNGAKAPFDQSANRKAVAKLIDLEEAIKDAYREELKPSMVPINNGSNLNSLKVNLFDKEALKKTELIGPMPNRIKIITDKTDPMKHRMAYIIKGQLAIVGIDSDVLGLTKEELNGAIEKGDFDMGVFSYEAPLNKDITKLIRANPKLFNLDFAKTTELMNGVYNKGNQTVQSQNYTLVQNELLNQMPYLGIGFRNEYNVYNQRIHGNLESTSIEQYNGIENIFIIEQLTPTVK